MFHEPVLPTNEFKNNLAKHIRRVKENPHEMVLVGAHRVPQVAIVAARSAMPVALLAKVATGAIEWEAQLLLAKARRKRGEVGHVGGDLGEIFAWLWQFDETMAVSGVGDFLKVLRSHPENGDSEITLETLLHALSLARPDGLSEFEWLRFLDKARREVPGFFCEGVREPADC